MGSRGDWGEVSHVCEISVLNDCESCGGMVAVKREPGRLLEQVVGSEVPVGNPEGEEMRGLSFLLCESMLKMVGLKSCFDTYKAAIPRWMSCMYLWVIAIEMVARERKDSGRRGASGTLSEIGICVVLRLVLSARLSLFWGAMTLIEEPIRMQLRAAVSELWISRVG